MNMIPHRPESEETMKLSFYGAAHEVTGTCYQLEVNGGRILVDCGLQQGGDVKNNQGFPFDPAKIDAVVLTHAHIDHSGRLPLLTKLGFEGPIYMTSATYELISIMLEDSAHIQKMDAEWENRKGKRAGKDKAEPLYDFEDVDKVLSLVQPSRYGEKINVLDGLEIMFTDAGHLLGSSSVQMWMQEGDTVRKIVFSGDIGNLGQPIIRDPQYIESADYVVMESTYGDRNHEHPGDYVEDLSEIIDKTLARGGNVIIPSFAIGRTQELLYFFREIKEKGLVKSVPDFKVFVDSPLAGKATRIYDGDLRGYADEETCEILRSGTSPTIFDGLRITESTDESKQLNEDMEPKIIISASGMCEAGRIRHHLKHNLWRQECTVIFVGYQANGTLGRIILEGAKKVRMFGEEIAVKAEIINFRGLSAHADRDGLLKWVGSFSPKPSKVFAVHGDVEVCDIFAESLRQLGHDAVAPYYRSEYDLLTDTVLSEGIKPEVLESVKPLSEASKAVYVDLLSAAERLMAVIRKNEGGANGDLRKFASQISELAEKWKR